MRIDDMTIEQLLELNQIICEEGVQKSVSPCGEQANALRLLAVKNARRVDAHF